MGCEYLRADLELEVCLADVAAAQQGGVVSLAGHHPVMLDIKYSE